MDGESKQKIYFAEFVLDKGKRRLLRGEEIVPLNAKAFDVLSFLTENAGRVVTKEEILNTVWENQFVEEANLAVQISQLRKALGEQKDNPRFLVTVPGKGYEFIADVEFGEDSLFEENAELSRVEDDPERFSAPVEESELEQRKVAPRIPTQKRKSKKTFYALAVLTFAVLAAVTGIAVYRYFSDVSPADVTSLAVLPFINESDNSETEYLSDGLSESVTFSLSGLPELRVMSRNSSFRYKGKDTDAKTIGKELNVKAVLMGRVSQLGDRISVSAELVSTADNSVIWGEQFTRKMSDIELLQTDIAQAISQKLRFKLSGADETRLARSQTENAEAYRLYLLGRYQLNKLTDEGFFKARDYFQQAIELDPAYALAYTGLADAYNRLSGWNALSPKEGFPKARAAALKALEIDNQLSEAYTTLGTVKLFYEWDWTGAESDLRKAIEINPNNSDARQMFGYYLMFTGRFDEALEEMRRANQLDPLSLDKIAGIGDVLFFKREYDEAIAQYRKILNMEPNSGFAHWALGNVYTQKGMYKEAIESYQKAIPLSGDSPDEPASLGFVYAISGRKPEARQIVEDLKNRSANAYVSPVVISFVYIGLDEKEQAFEWLEKAYTERDSLLTLLKVEPAFDRLRSDPRFSDLMRRVGFSP